MRIEFAHGSHEPVAWPGGTLRIGSAPGSDVCLEGAGVAGHHVRLSHDARGLVLDVERGAARVYVNARPVRERAWLRLGDTLGVGPWRLRLCADSVPADRDGDAVAVGTAAATVALRAVAGPLSGRVWPLTARMELDAQGPLTVPGRKSLMLLLEGRHVSMDAVALNAAVTVSVNGVATRRARLGDGDQLVLGTHRFVLDLSAVAEAPPPDPAPAVAAAPPPGTVHRQMGWLIATAVVVALILAWAFLA